MIPLNKNLFIKNWFLFQEVPQCPLWLVECAMTAFNGEMSQKYGIKGTHGVFAWQEGKLLIYMIKEEYEAAGKIILQKTLADTAFLPNILDEIEYKAEQLIQVAQQISALPAALSLKDLWQWYSTYHEAHHACWVAGQAINLMEMNNSLLLKEFESELAKTVPPGELNETINLLVKPERYNYGQKEVQALIQLAIQKSSEVKEHWKTYSWTGYDWNGPPWEESYFAERLELLKKDKKLVSYVQTEEEYACIIRKKKEESLRRYGISLQAQQLAKLLERIIFLKAYRVDASRQAYTIMEKLFQEIGRRRQLTVKQLKYVFPQDMKSLILQGRADDDALHQRWKCSAFLFYQGKIEELQGEEAQSIINELQKKTAVEMDAEKGVVKRL